MDITDKNILITGGASGFGAFFTNKLSELCKSVIVIDIKNKPENINAENIFFYKADLTNYENVTNVIADIYESHKIDILINNAGVIHSEPLINLLSRPDRRHKQDTWQKIIDVNLSSVFYVGSTVADKMIRDKIKGLIINISSISAEGNTGQTAYAAAKAGVNAMTSVWSKELAMFGIRTAAIAPGFFDTPSTKNALSGNIIKKLEKSIPAKRLGKLEELLSAVKFIVENDYYNGKILKLDGGLTIYHHH